MRRDVKALAPGPASRVIHPHTQRAFYSPRHSAALSQLRDRAAPHPASSAPARAARLPRPAAGEPGAIGVARSRRCLAVPACPTRLAKNPAAPLVPVGRKERIWPRRVQREASARAARLRRPAAGKRGDLALLAPGEVQQRRVPNSAHEESRPAGHATQRRAAFGCAFAPVARSRSKSRRAQRVASARSARLSRTPANRMQLCPRRPPLRRDPPFWSGLARLLRKPVSRRTGWKNPGCNELKDVACHRKA